MARTGGCKDFSVLREAIRVLARRPTASQTDTFWEEGEVEKEKGEEEDYPDDAPARAEAPPSTREEPLKADVARGAEAV